MQVLKQFPDFKLLYLMLIKPFFSYSLVTELRFLTVISSIPTPSHPRAITHSTQLMAAGENGTTKRPIMKAPQRNGRIFPSAVAEIHISQTQKGTITLDTQTIPKTTFLTPHTSQSLKAFRERKRRSPTDSTVTLNSVQAVCVALSAQVRTG